MMPNKRKGFSPTRRWNQHRQTRGEESRRRSRFQSTEGVLHPSPGFVSEPGPVPNVPSSSFSPALAPLVDSLWFQAAWLLVDSSPLSSLQAPLKLKIPSPITTRNFRDSAMRAPWPSEILVTASMLFVSIEPVSSVGFCVHMISMAAAVILQYPPAFDHVHWILSLQNIIHFDMTTTHRWCRKFSGSWHILQQHDESPLLSHPLLSSWQRAH